MVAPRLQVLACTSDDDDTPGATPTRPLADEVTEPLPVRRQPIAVEERHDDPCDGPDYLTALTMLADVQEAIALERRRCARIVQMLAREVVKQADSAEAKEAAVTMAGTALAMFSAGTDFVDGPTTRRAS